MYKIGDEIRCVTDSEELKSLGIYRGEVYTANSVMDLRNVGATIYVQVVVGGKVVVTIANHFEKVEEEDGDGGE